MRNNKKQSALEMYREALKEIANSDWCNSQESIDKIQEIAQVVLDGGPTTADEFNNKQKKDRHTLQYYSTHPNYDSALEFLNELKRMIRTGWLLIKINRTEFKTDKYGATELWMDYKPL